MQREGPPLELLTRRLAETPEDFLAEPRIGPAGQVEVAAVVGDLIGLLGGETALGQVEPFRSGEARQDRNRLGLVLRMCWLLADPWFRGERLPVASVMTLLDDRAHELAAQTAAGKFTTDPDRREELARLALAACGCRPAGESSAQAQDRLTRISSVERTRVMRAARAAEERARTVREALARKAAQESADKYTRE